MDPQEVEDFDAFTQKFWAALKSRIRKVRAGPGIAFTQSCVESQDTNACVFAALQPTSRPASISISVVLHALCVLTCVTCKHAGQC